MAVIPIRSGVQSFDEARITIRQIIEALQKLDVSIDTIGEISICSTFEAAEQFAGPSAAVGVRTRTSITEDYTVSLADETILADASGGSLVVTMLSVSLRDGKRYDIQKTDSSGNTVTIKDSDSDTIDILDLQDESDTLEADSAEATWRIK